MSCQDGLYNRYANLNIFLECILFLFFKLQKKNKIDFFGKFVLRENSCLPEVFLVENRDFSFFDLPRFTFLV